MEEVICKWYFACPIKRFYEQGMLEKEWIEEYCLRGGANCRRYEMEEKGLYHPDNMLPSGEIEESLI